MRKLSHVLILEDDPFWATFFKKLCAQSRIEARSVSTLSSFESAVGAARRAGRPVDGLIYDLGLDYDLHASLRNLHARLDELRIPTMVVTGQLDPAGDFARLAMTHPCVELFVQKAFASEEHDGFKSFLGISESDDFRAIVRNSLGGGIVVASSIRELTELKDRDLRTVFVIHGQDEGARRALFEFLRSINLVPIEWSKAVEMTGDPSPFIRSVLERAMDNCGAVVALLTGDEIAQLRPSLGVSKDGGATKKRYDQARPNVFIEIGMALAANPSRLVLVQIGSSKIPSDLSGMHIVRLSNSPESRSDLANRLRVCGCQVDLSGTDWLTTGDLTRTA